MKLQKSNLNYQISNKTLFLKIKNWKLEIGNSRQRRAGFTLIELIIYMGILSVLISVLMALFTSIVDVQLESKATSNVDQDSRYILARMAQDMQSAVSIASPSAGLTGNTLKIKINSIDYTYSLDGNSNLQLTNNNGTDVLNSVDTSISGLSFQRIGSGNNDDTIQMILTITSKTRKTAGTEYETRTFKTTLGRQGI